MPVAAAPDLEEREAELAAVARLLDAARAGTGAGLLVEGPPGIGKTRLLAGARALARGGLRVLAARASELERDFPFAVVRQLLEPVLLDDGAAELLAGAAALAGPVLAAPGAEGREDEPEPAALHGLYWLTANLAAREPVLVLVDDAQWADLPSLRWLAYLAHRLDGLPVALLAAARPAEGGAGQPVLDLLAANPSVEVLHPHELSEAAVTRVVDRSLPGCAPEFAAACRTATGGNPFLLGELVRELAVGGVAPTAANAGLVARQTSRTVGRAALIRLRRLPPAATDLARAVAVLGDGAEPAVAAALAALDGEAAAEAAAALEAASILAGDDAGIAAAGLGGGAAPALATGNGHSAAATATAGGRGDAPGVGPAAAPGDAPAGLRGDAPGADPAGGLGDAAVGGRRLSFVHPLVRASVYAELTAAERARAHRRAAELLARAGAAAERVAIHCHACDPAGDPEVVRVLREAAATARRRGGTEVAASHLRRALREPPDPEAELQVRRELGGAELQLGRMASAAEQLARPASELPDPRERALAAAQLGTALQLAGRTEEAVAALNRAIAELPDGERELGLLLQGARAASALGNAEAARLAKEAGTRFTASVDAPATPGERLYAARVAYGEATRGSALRAREIALRTLDLLRDPGPGQPMIYAAPLALLFSGALEEATRAWTAVLDWARAHGSLLSFAQALHLRSTCWLWRGNLAEAEADAEAAFAHPSYMTRPGVIVLVEVRLAQGDIDGAARLWAESGVEQDPQTGRSSVITRHARGRLLAAQGRRDEALAELLGCGAMEEEWGVRTPGYSTWRSDAVVLLAGLGRAGEARALAREDVERCRRFGDARPLGIALRAAGLAAGRDAGLARIEESVAVLRPSPARLELALSLLELGAAIRRAGRRADARGPLQEAVELAAACGATAAAARAHDELVAAGARPRRDPIESRSRLTASELRVARMAAEGMTNKEIAQALFLTEKTIEVHLTSTYRKLDISSRSQLPRALPAG